MLIDTIMTMIFFCAALVEEGFNCLSTTKTTKKRKSGTCAKPHEGGFEVAVWVRVSLKLVICVGSVAQQLIEYTHFDTINMNTMAVYGGFAIVLGTSALGTASSAPSWTLANLSNVQVRCECAADSIFVTLWLLQTPITSFGSAVPNPDTNPKIQASQHWPPALLFLAAVLPFLPGLSSIVAALLACAVMVSCTCTSLAA
jgi:hypothetical protein